MIQDAPLFDCRDTTVQTLADVADRDDRVCVVVNDSVGSSKLASFVARFPDRVINVGIAEQNMIGIAAGLANGGMIPFVFGASCFLSERALEQIKVDLAYSAANVKIVGVSSGMAYGELGPTHHSIEDLSWLRAIYGLDLVVPADPPETDAAFRAAAELVGPVFIRTSRIPVPIVHTDPAQLRRGSAVELRAGSDVTIIANGVLVSQALLAAEVLAAEGVSARVLNLSWLSPIDRDMVVTAALETGAIVTAEEATIRGGLGGAVAEIVVAEHPVPVVAIGVTEFAPTGSAAALLDHFGLSCGGIVEATHQVLARKR